MHAIKFLKFRVAVALTRSRGFSLIELMVVVAIAAILAAVAYPSYTSYVQRTRRTDATLLLSTTAQQLERCHAECNSYTATGCASVCPTLPRTSTDGYYTISLETGSDGKNSIEAHTFTLIARPVGSKSQINDTQCAFFSLNHLKQKDATNPAICWQ